MNSRESTTHYYGCMSMILVTAMCIVMTTFLVGTITDYWATMTVSNNQVAIAEAQRDSIIGVAVAQENGQVERTRIVEGTKVRTHWSFIPNRFVDVIFAVLGAMALTYVLGMFMGLTPKVLMEQPEPVEPERPVRKRRPSSRSKPYMGDVQEPYYTVQPMVRHDEEV